MNAGSPDMAPAGGICLFWKGVRKNRRPVSWLNFPWSIEIGEFNVAQIVESMAHSLPRRDVAPGWMLLTVE